MQDNQSQKNVSDATHQHELVDCLRDLKQWVSETSAFGIPHFGELGHRLEALQELLTCHFREEEAGGYLKEPLSVAPRFQREAEKLLKEHDRLIGQIAEFANRLKSTEEPFSTWQEASEIFDSLIADIESHEQHERALYQSAFEDDLGVGD